MTKSSTDYLQAGDTIEVCGEIEKIDTIHHGAGSFYTWIEDGVRCASSFNLNTLVVEFESGVKTVLLGQSYA